jgi:hypothetical protein
MVGQRQRHRNFDSYPACRVGPQYCRVTPTECRRFLREPVSSMIQASTGPLLDRRKHQLAPLDQHRGVRPRRVLDKMKQRLMLHKYTMFDFLTR